MKPKVRFIPYTKTLRIERGVVAYGHMAARAKQKMDHLDFEAEMGLVEQTRMREAYRVLGLKSNRILLKEPDGSDWPADKPKEHSNV